ncbi:MAG TPA: hypothetical protein VMV59_01415 [Candidatus Dormibacteraeota bacterium]|nr:hypothetical protein [Candidatus Dormibacteraeota bacterium]
MRDVFFVLFLVVWLVASFVFLASLVPPIRKFFSTKPPGKFRLKTAIVAIGAFALCLALAPQDRSEPVADKATFPEQSADQLYLNGLTQEAQVMSQSMGRFSDLCAHQDLFNNDWREKVLTELATWKIVYQDAQGLQPSARFSPVQQCWLSSLRTFSAAASGVASSFDSLNLDELKEASAEIADANAEANRCVKKLDIAALSSR